MTPDERERQRGEVDRVQRVRLGLARVGSPRGVGRAVVFPRADFARGPKRSSGVYHAAKATRVDEKTMRRKRPILSVECENGGPSGSLSRLRGGGA